MIDESNSRIVVSHLPRRIKSFTVYNRAEQFYTIVLSDQLGPDARLKAYKHEIDHIENDDFDVDKDVQEAELRAHGIVQKKEETEQELLIRQHKERMAERLERIRKQRAKIQRQLKRYMKNLEELQRLNPGGNWDPLERHERHKDDPDYLDW